MAKRKKTEFQKWESRFAKLDNFLKKQEEENRGKEKKKEKEDK